MSSVIDALSALRAEFSVSRGTALQSLVQGSQWDMDAARDVGALIMALVDAFGEQEANVGVQHWFLCFMTDVMPRLAEYASSDDMALWIMFAGTTMDNAVTELLPASIDFVAALFRTVCAQLHRFTDVDAGGMFSSLKPLVASLVAQLRSSGNAPVSTVTAAAVHALRDICLALTPLDGDAHPGQSAAAVAQNRLIPGYTVPDTAAASAIVDQVLAALFGVFEWQHSPRRAVLASLCSLDTLLRHRRPALWKPILNHLFGRTVQRISKRDPGVAPGCFTQAFGEAFLATCTLVALEQDAAPAFQKLASAAASALNLTIDGKAEAVHASTLSAIRADEFLHSPSGTHSAENEDVEHGGADPGAGGVEAREVETTFGRIPLGGLIDTIFTTLRHLPPALSTESALLEAHQRGVAEMMTRTALKFQQQEYERARAHQARGSETIPIGKIMARVPGCDEPSTAKGNATIQQPRLRGAFARSAFLAALKTYSSVADAASSDACGATLRKSKVCRAEALVSRVLPMVSEDAIDACLDAICENLGDAFAAGETHAPHKLRSLLQQVLYCLYTDLAPSSNSANTFSFQNTSTLSVTVFSGTDGSGIEHVDVGNPILWMIEPVKASANDDEDEFVFATESTDRPTTVYSTLLCRVLSVLAEHGDYTGILDLLCECPAITVPAWIIVHRKLCMSDSPPSVDEGIRLVAALRNARPTVAKNCISLLLFYSTCAKNATRLYALREILEFHDQPTMSIATEYAKAAALRLASAKIPPSVELSAVEMDRVAARYLKLFSLLSVKDVSLLFPHLFDTHLKLREGDPRLRSALLQSADIARCLQHIFRLPPRPGEPPQWTTCLKLLKQAPPGAEDVALMVEQVFCTSLQQLARDDAGGSAAILGTYARILIRYATDVFAASGDVRFMVPVFPFITVSEVCNTYLTPVLQQLFGEGSGNATAVTVADQERALKSLMRDGRIKTGENEPCGMTPQKLFVHLHTMHDSARYASRALDLLIKLTREIPGPDGTHVTAPVLDITELCAGLHHLVQMKPISPLLMRSALAACALDCYGAPLKRFVHIGIVRELLVKQTGVQYKALDLWKGAEVFLALHFGSEAIETLSLLPTTTLGEMLRRNATLRGLLAPYGPNLAPNVQQILRDLL